MANIRSIERMSGPIPGSGKEDIMGAAPLWEELTAPGSREFPRRPQLRLVPTGPQVGGRAVAPRPARVGRLRVTRLGRLVATVAGLAVAIAVVSIVVSGWFAGAPADRGSVTVRPGQTLSQIAAHELPQLPVPAAVVQIQQRNGLSSDQVAPGQTLVIPSF